MRTLALIVAVDALAGETLQMRPDTLVVLGNKRFGGSNPGMKGEDFLDPVLLDGIPKRNLVGNLLGPHWSRLRPGLRLFSAARDEPRHW